jgi:hypothetical protein
VGEVVASLGSTHQEKAKDEAMRVDELKAAATMLQIVVSMVA